MVPIKTWLGKPYPLGATWKGNGVNFALYSENATGVDLCLFDDIDAPAETIRVRMTEQSDEVWHVFLPEVAAGPALRLSRPRAVRAGKGAPLQLGQAADRSLREGHRGRDQLERRDVRLRAEGWGRPGARLPRRWLGHPEVRRRGYRRSIGATTARRRRRSRDSVIYEVHVKGFSQLCPHVPEEMRGTYAAMATPWAVEYFKNLGVTAVELLPVHQFVNDKGLIDKGLTNYWGYNSIGYFAPDCTLLDRPWRRSR